MPHIFVRSEMNERDVQRVFAGASTYLDFHQSIDQNRSHLYRELAKVFSLKVMNDLTHSPRYSLPQYGQYSQPAHRDTHRDTATRSAGWKTYRISAPSYVVLNALETCGYKVVAASSTAIRTQYMWTLQGPVDREVDPVDQPSSVYF